jgi:zinc/manganese transport system substrate-binding protein
VLIAVGRDLEIGWLPPLTTQSRNPKLQPGGSGYLDASLTAKVLELPQGQITRAMGDVHPLGNPHYWLDPENGKRIAKAMADKFAEQRSGDRTYFEQRLGSFVSRLDEAEKRWLATMAPFKGIKVVTYHPGRSPTSLTASASTSSNDASSSSIMALVRPLIQRMLVPYRSR